MQAKQPRQKQTNRLIIYRLKHQEVSGKFINMNSFINIRDWQYLLFVLLNGDCGVALFATWIAQTYIKGRYADDSH